MKHFGLSELGMQTLDRPIPGTAHPRHLDENLGAPSVTFSPAGLRGFTAAACRIGINWERLCKEPPVMSGREAPLGR